MLIEDIVFCTLLFILMIIGQYVTYRRIGTTIKQNKIHLKEASYYELGRKYVDYKRKMRNSDDIIELIYLQQDIDEDVKILLEEDG